MSYMTRDDLNKYLKNLSSPTPQQQTPPKTPTPQASKTPQDYASERRASSSTGLRGPRPPSISSPRTSFSKNPASPSVEDLKNDLSYPFERKMNLNDSSPVAKSAQNLKNAVGMTASRPPPPVKAKPANLSRSSSVTSNDAFESSLARGKPLPPAHPKAVTQPKVSTQPSINPPPSSTEVPVPSPSSPSPSANEKVSVPNPLYSSILCAGCSKPISGVVISAMNKRWHASCFKCKECGENLEHMAYQEKDGVPYCALDFHEKFSVKCDYCHTPIEENIVSALGKHYHPGHFFCIECGHPFDGGYLVHDGQAYCEKDYLRKFGQKCMGCGEYITTGEFVNALDGDWHRDCFVCTECKEPFEGDRFYVRDRKPYCQHHAKASKSSNVRTSNICAGCGDYIEGRAASALGQKWHPNHFQCVSCKKELSASVPGMWQDNGNAEPICKMCARKM